MKRIAALLLAVIPLLFAACEVKRPADRKASPDSALHPATLDSTMDQASPDQALGSSGDSAQTQAKHKTEKKIDKKYFLSPLRNRSAQIDTEELMQNPELPTGCESVALTSALRSLGFKIEKTEIADKYLTYGEDMMWSYVGDPEEIDGAGIYPPGLTNCANDYLKAKKSKYTAYNTMGTKFEDLFKLIENGCPVLIWTTMDYEEPVLSDVAFDYNGKYYYWYGLEHCVMLCGYDLDEETVTINDPLEGIITIDLDQMKSVYDGIDRLSMTIMENKEDVPTTVSVTENKQLLNTQPLQSLIQQSQTQQSQSQTQQSQTQSSQTQRSRTQSSRTQQSSQTHNTTGRAD